MQIKQWKDENLAQFSYAILSDDEKKIILIDPSRNPQAYLDFAAEHHSDIVGVIETHPHADFVSSHLEISQLAGAPIYTSSFTGADYAHQDFDEGNHIDLGKIKLTAMHTPGHSPDSISVLLEYEGQQKAVFTGDTLFIGDCGRPDLREGAGNLKITRVELAKSMYHSLRNKMLPLEDDVIVYPAHGAGTLCGKGLSEAGSSTIKNEKQTNWCLQPMTEKAFIDILLEDQPFVPAYFPYNVEINRKGADAFEKSIAAVKKGVAVENESEATRLKKEFIIVDARPEKQYKKAHLPNSVNLMEGTKFETWLGTIIQPGELFYLTASNEDQLQRLIERTAAIGYEPQIIEAFVLTYGNLSDPLLDLKDFEQHTNAYTIVDLRNVSELKGAERFKNSISIPLPELRNKVTEIPVGKPIVVHCAGGYRSAAGSSLIKSILKDEVEVFDLGEEVKKYI